MGYLYGVDHKSLYNDELCRAHARDHHCAINLSFTSRDSVH